MYRKDMWLYSTVLFLGFELEKYIKKKGLMETVGTQQYFLSSTHFLGDR